MNLSEEDLIVRLKSNDREAYNYIFRTYYMELYYIALKYLDNTEEAKDLVQSTFIKIWEKRLSLIAGQSIKPYLFTIHKNNCLDKLKNKNSKINKFSVRELDATDQVGHLSGPPDENLIVEELEYKIIKAISLLPERCRIIFEYSRFHELTYGEIAQKLSISIKTVENQMSIALDKLRTHLVDILPLFILFLIRNF